MKKKTEADSTQVLHFYSSSDKNIASVMITLGIFNYIAPPYAASLIFELRRKKKKNIVTVRINKNFFECNTHQLVLTKSSGI